MKSGPQLREAASYCSSSVSGRRTARPPPTPPAERGVEDGQAEHHRHTRQHEQRAGRDPAAHAVQQPAEVGSELLRFRPGQERRNSGRGGSGRLTPGERRSSTTSRCSSPICPAGPPKDSSQIFSQTRSASPKEGRPAAAPAAALLPGRPPRSQRRSRRPCPGPPGRAGAEESQLCGSATGFAAPVVEGVVERHGDVDLGQAVAEHARPARRRAGRRTARRGRAVSASRAIRARPSRSAGERTRH